MFRLNKNTVRIVALWGICIMLAGCGNHPQSVQHTETPETEIASGETLAQPEEEIFYQITEITLPRPEDAVSQDIPEGDEWTTQERGTRFWEEKLYRLFDIYETVEEMNFYRGVGIQVLAPPYDHWDSQIIWTDQAISEQGQEDSDLPVSGLNVDSLAGATEDGVFLKMRSSDNSKCYLAHLTWDGGLEVLAELPEEYINDDSAFCYLEDEKYWVFSGMGKVLTVFDQAGQQESSRNLTGWVTGTLKNPQSGERIWYGFDQGEFALWEQPAGQVSARVTNQIKNQRADYAIAYSPTGELFLANEVWTWSYDGKTLREEFSFVKKDYTLEGIDGIWFREDGALQLMVIQEGERCFLTAETGSAAEKRQEIQIVINNSDPGLERLAARYNRRSQEYHVSITTAEEAAEPQEYRQRVQMEMVAGRGPDLLGEWTVDIQDCAAQGYLEPLDGVVEDMSPFLEAAFERGMINGQPYGIPYQCYPYLLAVSTQVADASAWTREQMYDAVRNSSAEILGQSLSGVDIIMACGLYDEECKDFIDWEKGESHLTEEPFLELMAFAKEYADRGEYSYSEMLEGLANGRVAGQQVVMKAPEDFKTFEMQFDGKVAYIGYPRESGCGIYMEARSLYLNHSAENREGALDFLRYIITEEGQRKYMDYSSVEQIGMVVGSYLPVRRNLLQECLDRYQRDVKNPPREADFGNGKVVRYDKLDEEEIECYWRILDNAIPAVFQSDKIWSIVDEELQPYFNDMRSAEEAAAILHSRVQLFLDERK